MKIIKYSFFVIMTFFTTVEAHAKNFTKISDDILIDVICALEIAKSISKKTHSENDKQLLYIYNSKIIYAKFNITHEQFIDSLSLLVEDIPRLKKIFNRVSEKLQSFL